MYNYIEEIKKDIIDYLEDNFINNYSDIDDIEELENELNDNLFNNDSITGNASGSYTCNSYISKEYVIDNMDILKDALYEFCVDSEIIVEHFLNEDYEYFDVTIRCYLLGQAINEVLEDYKEDFDVYFNNRKVED